MDNFKPTYYPEEITEAILSLSGCTMDCTEDLHEALYEIKTIAENHYNSDFWRTLYHALERMTEEHEQAERREKLRLPPRVIVEIMGGAMQNVYSDVPVEIGLMDYDNMAATCSEELHRKYVEDIQNEEEYERMQKEFADWNDEIKAGTLQRVW